MSSSTIPEKTTVLVAGGGPAGSYTACLLAREGYDVTVFEGDKFPRYHIGESMLPSMRHFLKFIDLDDQFDKAGFYVKKGAMFKLNKALPPAYTDFIQVGGPNGYSWNIVRSEADNMIFQHAGKEGAHIFDEIKVTGIDFDEVEGSWQDPEMPNPGKPTAAHWQHKDGSTGTIKFDYFVDCSGRAGIISTKYLKNRRYNQGLKNMANWGYYKNVKPYGKGTDKEGVPYFEALNDASGWVWTIPLGEKTSVGVVQQQKAAAALKQAKGTNGAKEYYQEALKLVPGVCDLLEDAELISDITAASDWSYSASHYAFPNVRIAGDAACFIDPFFSSGVHLGLNGGMSAAVTIAASLRGTMSERAAAEWHSKKISEGYTRFLLVVLSALKQIRSQDEAVLNDWDEDSFERAFAHFRPIIQGNADVKGQLTQNEISDTVNFCFQAFKPTGSQEDRDEVMKKVAKIAEAQGEGDSVKAALNQKELQESLSEEEIKILKTIQARQMLRTEDSFNIDNFSADAIDGMVPNLVRGELDLIDASKIGGNMSKVDVMALLTGDGLLNTKGTEAGAAAPDVVASTA